MKTTILLCHLQVLILKSIIIYHVIIKKEYILLAIMIFAVIGYLYASKDDFISLFNKIKGMKK